MYFPTSFTDNGNNTFKDKTSGVIFMDDPMDNWNQVFEKGADLGFDSNPDPVFGGDYSRAVRANNKKDCWFTYKLESGITEVAISTFITKGTTGYMELYVSKDNKNWTKVNLTTSDSNLGYDWYRRVYTGKGIASSNIYAKIVFSKDNSSSQYDPSYIPQVGRVRINNVDKMDSPDRYLEDRYSATFYVDSKNGSDNNDGKSPEKAFKSLYKVSSKYYQPGDKILFKKGQTFNGSLELRGFGNAQHEIYVGSYGSGKAPSWLDAPAPPLESAPATSRWTGWRSPTPRGSSAFMWSLLSWAKSKTSP